MLPNEHSKCDKRALQIYSQPVPSSCRLPSIISWILATLTSVVTGFGRFARSSSATLKLVTVISHQKRLILTDACRSVRKQIPQLLLMSDALFMLRSETYQTTLVATVNNLLEFTGFLWTKRRRMQWYIPYVKEKLLLFLVDSFLHGCNINICVTSYTQNALAYSVFYLQ